MKAAVCCNSNGHTKRDEQDIVSVCVDHKKL